MSHISDMSHMSEIDRRTFLRAGAAAGAFVTLGGCAAGGGDSGAPGGAAAGEGAAGGGAAGVPDFALDEITIDEVHEGMRTGEYTCRSITEMYLERIEALNRQGPRLFAVLEVNPDALEIADALDREFQAAGPRGPLHGIPILLKDNIDTADGMTTTAGSTALRGSIAPQDSFVAAGLRGAGALLLGKANMSEWAGWKSFEFGASGWSGRGWDGGRGGFCGNPYALDRTPGGSSSGSGAGAAANLAVAAIGSETDGSIVGPSSRNCLVGIKPTIGLHSRGGVIPIAHSQDSTGPMARTVRDAAIMLGTMVGVDPRDPLTAASAGNFLTDYTGALDPGGLNGARVGVLREYAGFDSRVDALFEEGLDVMRAEGATVVDPVTLPEELRFGNEHEMEVLYHEFKTDLNAYLASLGPGAPIKSLAELIEYNEANHDLELALYGQELHVRSQERGPLTDQRYIDALAASHRLSRDEGIDRAMGEHRLDALVGITAGIPALQDPLDASGGAGGGCSTPPAMAAYPNMSVPMGFIGGLPIGMSMCGRAWSEATLVRLAYAFEQTTNHRRPPTFQASVQV
ncbi:amidase [Candidatus Palauibacter sp.]|uniref:amidase n=1 Tax=Candidatus Palauibacter sp. TaxID=3101350 RepID=UPI003C6F3915